MDISRLLRQTCAWAAQTGLDDRGERSFADPTTVACRKMLKQHDIIGKNGEVVTSAMQFLVLVAPAIGDTLDGREVISIQEQVDFTGTVLGRIILTR